MPGSPASEQEPSPWLRQTSVPDVPDVLKKGSVSAFWSENDERLMDDFSSPEILDADLSVLILEILRWGAGGKDGLKWMDPPPAAHYYQALELLRLLGVTDGEGQLTQEGKSLGSWSVHPRLAHMLERFAGTPLEQTACALAALLEEGGLDGQPQRF